MSERPTLNPRERMAIDRTAMPEQDPTIRAHTFTEVNLGFSHLLAAAEAERCLQCKKPTCIDGCPVRVNIPRFIDLVAEGDLRGAAESLLDDNALPCVTGRVCPQESQCEGRCVRGKKGQPVAVGALERFVADWAMQHQAELTHTVHPPSGKRVAIVGSGPAGLTAAGELVKTGHHVTIFEAFHAAGGVLIYGIPEFRLPKDIVQAEIDRLKADGVEIEVNAIVGKTWTLRELRSMYDAIFVAVGAGLPVFMDVPGREPQGCLLRQRVPHPRQPHGRVPGGLGHPGAARTSRGRGRWRQRRDGLRPDVAPAGRRRGGHRLSPRSRGAARTSRGGSSRGAGGRPVRRS